MNERKPNPKHEQSLFNQIFGEDFKAALRQGLAEIREATIAFPGQTPIAQPVQYGAIGNPPPSLVAGNVKDREKGYSIEELKERGRQILGDRDNDQHQDRGHGNDR